MLFLNLLPSQFKTESKLKNLFWVVVRAGNILLFTAIIISASFYVSYKILDNFFDVVNNTSFLMQTQVENPIEVKKVNRRINNVEDIQSRSFTWIGVFDAISHNMPRDIYIESLEIDKQKNKVSMQGIALTRQSLVYLKENLENSSQFTDMKFPLENILKKKDIHFDITFKFQSSKIDKYEE